MNLLHNILKRRTQNKLFTTPSHSGNFCVTHKFYQFYKHDISETDTHNPEEALKNSERFATNIYGTVTTKYLTNGSTSGIIAAVLACVKKGEKVLIWDKAHPCHKNSIELAGANAVEYSIPLDSEWGCPSAITPEILHSGLEQGVKAVIITSPSYEGIVSDIVAIKKICENYGAYLIVDEAHGALYPFCEKLPQSAVNIADFTVQSLHKTAGGLNPTALLHTMTNLDITQALSKFMTTSPSYPLLMSIENNIKYLNSQKGRKKILELVENIEQLKSNCNNVEFFNSDITKILIKKDGFTGFKLSEKLFEHGIEDEKTNNKSTLLLTGLGTSTKKLDYLFKILKKI